MTTLRNKLMAVREQVREAYRNGATLRKIAEAHGVSTGTVRMALLEMGETLRPRGRRRSENAQDADIPVVDLDSLVEEERFEENDTQFEGDDTYEGGVV